MKTIFWLTRNWLKIAYSDPLGDKSQCYLTKLTNQAPGPYPLGPVPLPSPRVPPSPSCPDCRCVEAAALLLQPAPSPAAAVAVLVLMCATPDGPRSPSILLEYRLGRHKTLFFHYFAHAHAAGCGPYGPPRYDTEGGSMGKLGTQRAQIRPYAPPRRRIWLGLA